MSRRYFGHAAHLCVGPWCLFHIATQVGGFMVSTVGDYRPVSEREGEGFGPAREIGVGRLFETFVFRIIPNRSCGCGCGLPDMELSEIDTAAYNDALAATEGHERMCQKYERKRTRKRGTP